MFNIVCLVIVNLAHKRAFAALAIAAALVVSAFLGATAFAATNVAGPITSSTTWTLANSPYTVTADVSVDTASSLTIEAGVTVLFTAGTNFIINNGNVIAKGTAAAPIIFTSAKDVVGATTPAASGDWGQIRFTAGTVSATTEFDNTQIRFGAGVVITNSSPTINRLSISNCAGPAISVDLLSSPKGVGLTASGNTLNGIRVPAGEVSGNITWSLIGIPYVLETGDIAVGAPATITAITPATVAAGQVLDAVITGTRLTAAESVVIDRAGVTAAIQAGASATSIPIKITAAANAAAGAASLTLQVAAGLVTAPFTVTAPKPTVSILPNPIAIPPDNSARSFSINLSRSDTIDYPFTVASDNPAIASVSAATATIVAGQTRVALTVSGIVAGQTTLRVNSAALGNVAVPVFVTTEFAGLNTTYSGLVGIQVGDVVLPPTGSSFTSLLATGQVGVSIGAVLDSLSPALAIIGTSSTLTLQGAGFPSTLTITVSPPDGVVLGAPTVAADGKSAQVAVTVGSTAPLGLRQVLLRASSAANAAAIYPGRPDADRLLISPPVPQIDSVSPQFGRAGDVFTTFFVRGRNLNGADALNFAGGAFVVGSNFTVSADGSTLSVSVSIPANAATGARTVTVRTPAGDSSSTPTPANTFVVVSQITAYDPIVSPAIGVNVGSATTAVTTTYADFPAARVGVNYGVGIAKTTPRTAAIGETLTLRLRGIGLSGVTTVAFNPATGITAGTLVVAADGSSVDIPLVIASDAPLAPRAITVSTATQKLHFADPQDGVFTVTAPQPVVDSVSPIVLLAGSATNTLTLRGRNFQGATVVNVSPSAGLSISPPTVSLAGDTATVNIAVAANATLGDHIVSIVAAAGESNLTPGINNTLKIVATVAGTFEPIVSGLIGVQVGTPAATTTTYATQLVSPIVGVDIPITPVAPLPTNVILFTQNVAVNVGATASSINQTGLLLGSTATFIVQGTALPANTVVSVMPATGITLGTPVVAADGTTLSVGVTAGATTTLGAKALQLKTGSTDIHFLRPAAAVFYVGIAAPTISSISPITAKQGETVTLTIRGANMAEQPLMSPATGSGFTFDPSQQTIAADGSQLTIRLRIEPNATLGSTAIQVRTPLGSSPATPSAANTFTVTLP